VTSQPEPGSDEVPPPPTTPVYGPPSYGPVHYGQAGFGPPQHGLTPRAYQPYLGGQGQYPQPGLLCAAADRERTMDVLKAAFTEGRLTKSEFDERSTRVLSARTYADLNGLVADLPIGPGAPMMPFFGGIPAVIFGHVAREQIRRTGERGEGLAIGGLVLGYLWLSMWTLVILLGMIRG